jgi:hypothetical protein
MAAVYIATEGPYFAASIFIVVQSVFFPAGTSYDKNRLSIWGISTNL